MKRLTLPALIVTVLACCALAACVTRHARMVKQLEDAIMQVETAEFPAELDTQWRYPGSGIQIIMALNSDTLKDGVLMLETSDSFEPVAQYYRSLSGKPCELESTIESTDEEGHQGLMLSFSGDDLEVNVSIEDDGEHRLMAITYSIRIKD